MQKREEERYESNNQSSGGMFFLSHGEVNLIILNHAVGLDLLYVVNYQTGFLWFLLKIWDLL
jgi:hypothetical protein